MPTPATSRRFRLDWPLLGKELLEQAARKQTYIMRVTYAFVLFGAFVVYYIRNLGVGEVLALGRGEKPFLFLVDAQFVTIFLFLPPMMAGAIAQEKERDTLGLLFLTNLTPWQLILQKYIGRLIPMLSLLLLSLPLLAITYSLGGVSLPMLLTCAQSLFFTCLAVGALALECSAHESTTFQALVRCWGLCLVFLTCCWSYPFQIWRSFLAPGPANMTYSAIYLIPMITSAIAYLVPTLLFLVRAKENLEARAFVQRRNPFAQQFKQLDQYWKDTRKLTRAMLRRRDREAYALARQVVRTRSGWIGEDSSLAGFFFAKMQLPNVLAFGIIVGFIGLVLLSFTVAYDAKTAPFFIFTGAIWVVAVLTLPVQSANAVASERMNERLPALLTTPLSARELIDEWLVPVRRWILFLTRPLIIIILIEVVVKFKTLGSDAHWHGVTVVALYLAISLLAVFIYPRLIQWFCFWIGLRIRSQIRAMMTAFLAVAGWCIIPLVLPRYLAEVDLLPRYWAGVISLVSPITVLEALESIWWNSPTQEIPEMFLASLMHLILAAALMWKIRQICLTRADQYLGRI